MATESSITLAKSPKAQAAYTLVQSLQSHFGRQMQFSGDTGRYEPVAWLRDDGRHGGGTRLTYGGGAFFNRASLNVSHVQYDDLPERPLGSASAISSIVHPSHPQLPSIHLHISWTEMKSGDGYWRVMADLNPSIESAQDQKRFTDALRQCGGDQFEYGSQQGERYFHIPALKRHRGVSHFYLEQFGTGDGHADSLFAERFGKGMIDVYAQILKDKAPRLAPPTAAEQAAQLNYHTVYLFQVLTLDRGTTSGLLVHDQNDLGILGSLPARVDRTLLATWAALVPKPQDELVKAIAEALAPDGSVGDKEKLALCQVLRRHYTAYPAALDLQARGDVLPPTVQNHQVNT